ncbi:MAG: hypothetical protein E6G00_01910 [Actinobacteria bacterium]|nr:MAG: hypothetical protein E6G00_01910 [Actinomycetota bacterium]
MRYFQAVRLYSALEACVFTALLTVWIGGLGSNAQLVLGWCHGFGWIILSVLVLPLGPLGSTIGFEVLRRRGWREARVG